jgi:hypothetical protein
MIGPAPKHKREMYERLARGEFGNTVTTARSTIEALKHRHIRWWNIRGTQLGTSYWRPNIPRDNLFEAEFKAQQAVGRDGYILSEQIGNHNILFQGHLGFDPYPVLEWTARQTFLKHLFEGEYHRTQGLAVWPLIRRTSDATDWLERLAYESGGIVEFSVFNRRCGNLHSNTIIWEVRSY